MYLVGCSVRVGLYLYSTAHIQSIKNTCYKDKVCSFTFEQLLFTDTVGVSLRGRWTTVLLRRLRVEKRQQGAAVVPAGVVGKVGANETIGEVQLLLH